MARNNLLARDQVCTRTSPSNRAPRVSEIPSVEEFEPGVEIVLELVGADARPAGHEQIEVAPPPHHGGALLEQPYAAGHDLRRLAADPGRSLFVAVGHQVL